MQRIIDFSDSVTNLHVKNSQLVISVEDGREASTPLCEIAAVIFSGWRLVLTKSVLEELSRCGAMVVVCDEKKLPVGMMAPLCGHHLQSRCMREQAAASVPLQKKLWQQVVCAKIRSQSQVLFETYQTDYALGLLEKQVKSGDLTNIEARAARKYWSKLFGDLKFSRNPENGDNINSALNYGYAVLRSLIARAVVSSGLNPSLGLFHHNKYDPFCLADDLMEPFRPVIDKAILDLQNQDLLKEGLTVPVKRALIERILGRYRVEGRQETIFEAAVRAAASLTAAFAGRESNLCLPTRLPT